MSFVDGASASIRQAVVGARAIVPGLLLSAFVALAAQFAEAPLGRLLMFLVQRPVTVPAMVVALILGIALSRVAARPMFTPGMTLCIKQVLRVAIALLGIRIAMADIVALGPATAALVVGSMALTVCSGLWIGRLLRQTDPFGALAGCATAVCGASAALATSTVLPIYPNKHADTAFTVVAVNALSTIAMIAYPPLCALIGFDDRTTGIMLGATIHDVAQVAGAGYSVSEGVGDNAVIVKLFRVLLLVPVVLWIASHFAARGAHSEGARLPVPGFALVFIVLVLVNSFGLMPLALKSVLIEISRAGLLLAIAALGLATSMRDLARSGWRQIAVVTATTFVILIAVTGGLLAIR